MDIPDTPQMPLLDMPRAKSHFEKNCISSEWLLRPALNAHNTLVPPSGGIYGVSGISMDIPGISMFHKQVTLCHQSGDTL